MPREGDKWRVASGDCLWNIARAVYGNGARWPEIAAANGLPTSGSPIIHPGQLFTLPGITASSVPAPAPAPPPPPPAYTYQPNIVWFSLVAGSRDTFIVIFEQAHNKFNIRWEVWTDFGQLYLGNYRS